MIHEREEAAQRAAKRIFDEGMDLYVNEETEKQVIELWVRIIKEEFARNEQ